MGTKFEWAVGGLRSRRPALPTSLGGFVALLFLLFLTLNLVSALAQISAKIRADGLALTPPFGTPFGRRTTPAALQLIVQPRMVVGPPVDAYEREADRIPQQPERLALIDPVDAHREQDQTRRRQRFGRIRGGSSSGRKGGGRNRHYHASELPAAP